MKKLTYLYKEGVIVVGMGVLMQYLYLKILLVSATVFLFDPNWCFAQSADESSEFSLTTRKNRAERLDINVVHNLVLIPIWINNADEALHFILDTGVGTPLVTSLPDGYEVSLNYVDMVKIAGLGGESLADAFSAHENSMEIERISGLGQDIYVLKEDLFQLSSYMGTETNGLIGYNLFKDFIVEIDYSRGWVKFHSHERFGDRYQEKKESEEWGTLPLSFRNNKPYVDVEILQQDGTSLTATLLIDSGASHGLSLYPSKNLDIHLPHNRLYSLLGTGLSGGIEGYIGKVDKLMLDQFELDHVITNYPNENDILRAVVYSSRDGSIGADVLRRFKVMFNYRDQSMIFKPSSEYDEEFTYNRAGIELIAPIPDISIFEISYVRKDSPADKAGFLPGDFLSKVNHRFVSDYNMNELIKFFEGEYEEFVEIEVTREDTTFSKELHLIDELEKGFILSKYH